MYKKAKEVVSSGRDLDLDKIYICSVCGYTTEEKLPEYCPVCGVSQSEFKEFQKRIIMIRDDVEKNIGENQTFPSDRRR